MAFGIYTGGYIYIHSSFASPSDESDRVDRLVTDFKQLELVRLMIQCIYNCLAG